MSLNLFRRPVQLAAALSVALWFVAGSAYAQTSDPGDDAAANAPAMAMGSGRMVRGTVTSVAGDRLTLKTESGDNFSVALTPNTRVMKDRQQSRAADIKVGDGIGAMGELDQPSKTIHALFVSLIDAADVKKMKDTFGKTWISGKITAIDDLKITILRSDKVPQTIAVDEDTSFKRGGRGMAMAMQGAASIPMEEDRGHGGNTGHSRDREGGEPITLADVKIGDMVAGQGAIKNGIFVPTTLAVADPSQRQHHQRGGQTGSPSNPAAASNAAANPQ